MDIERFSGGVDRRSVLTGIASALVGAVAMPAFAQTAPEIRRLEVIIPLSAGGGSDIMVRQLMEHVRPLLSSQIAISNVPGDGSLLGLSRLARASPDEAVIGVHNPPNTVLSQLARGASAPVDIRTLTPIAGFGRTFTVLATSTQSGIETYQQLQQAYESGAQRLLGGTDRAGSSELTAELLRSQADLKFEEYVAYDGSGAGNAAIARNEVPAGLASYEAVIDGMASGTLRPLLVLGNVERVADMPDAPTVAELGYPSMAEVAAPIRVIVGPPNMEQSLRDYLVGLFRDVVTNADVVKKMAEAGIKLEYMSPEAVGQSINGAFEKLESLPVLQQMLARK
ncbi:tripartite tricarboxylate transporter substrate binding protein [Chelativorans sp. J32]|uniref:Bug family tripartite tricarboxylate transporter substrate binding protein n=1 Tax=Chelativorans sp. J32 TaxID=935840 RepID=UPI0004896492|nr:tripartite tricarboxylate transporter substrate-binding protein [Chelativorans sp. J32]